MAKSKRFAFEEAEAVLDAFAASSERRAQFRRAYRKFKWLIAAYACLDFAQSNKPSAQAFSYAWEDAQMAFTGHGEAILVGAVLQMWVYLDEGKESKAFSKAITKAFKKAEKATDPEVKRRYFREYRLKPPRTPEEGFDLPTIIPVWGPKTVDWALDEGEDLPSVLDEFSWLEEADRYERREEKAEKKRKKQQKAKIEEARPKLMLIHNKDEVSNA